MYVCTYLLIIYTYIYKYRILHKSICTFNLYVITGGGRMGVGLGGGMVEKRNAIGEITCLYKSWIIIQHIRRNYRCSIEKLRIARFPDNVFFLSFFLFISDIKHWKKKRRKHTGMREQKVVFLGYFQNRLIVFETFQVDNSFLLFFMSFFSSHCKTVSVEIFFFFRRYNT